MLSLHNIKRIRARASESSPDSNWVELHMEGGWVQGEPEILVLNLYFNSSELARAFYESYPDKLTESEIQMRRFYGNNTSDREDAAGAGF
jgi:hypothetical protein